MAFHSHEAHFSPEDADKAAEFTRRMMDPQAVDQMIHQAISICWMMLPAEKKTIEGLEGEVRRIVDRALSNLKEDARALGIQVDS